MASIFRVYNFVVLCFLFLLHAKVDASVTWRNQPTSATGIRGQSVSITWTADLVVNETWNFVKVYQKVSGTKYEMIRERKDYGKTVYSRYSSREADLSLTASQNGTLLTTVFTLNNLNRPTDEHIYYLRIDHTANGGDSDDSSDLQLTVFDGILWDAPPEHINVEQGHPVKIQWDYKMEENIFVLSEIKKFLPASMGSYSIALRHKEENTYEKYQKDDASFSISGKNNVIHIVHSAEIGQNITYCCEVRWRSVAGIERDSTCSKVFVYNVPRITNHIPRLSCKQGDSIKLKCNATGIPKPHVVWLHKETHELIDISSDIVLNITGKVSEGRYCCVADNRFGRETACTFLNVTEFKPVNPMLLVNQTNRDDVNIIHIKCKAEASPPSEFFIISMNDKEYNSSNGKETIEVPAPRNDKMNITVSCIPYNKYGEGPIKKITSPLYVRTASNCSTADKGLDQRNPSLEGWIVAIIVVCIIIVIVIIIIIIIVIFFWWRKKLEQKDQEPIDSVVPERSNATATEMDEATAEEIMLSWQPISNNNPQHGKDPTYQSVPQEP